MTKINLKMELNDAMAIVAAFSPDAKNDFMKEQGIAALKRMEKQVDDAVDALSSSEEQKFY